MARASILIVEDEQIVALDIENSLSSSGYSIAGQTDRGEDAVIKAGALRPDLVLMDIGLRGEVDGIEAAIQIRQQFDLPVIFLTAFTTPTILERARRAEPFGYVVKPFDERELISNIEMSIHKHSMEKKLRASENKFRGVIENSSDAIVLADSHGILIEWNSAAERITGLKRADVLGLSQWEVVFRMLPEKEKTASLSEALRKQWEAIVNSAYANGLEQMLEIEIQHPLGECRVIQTNGFVIDVEQGRLAGAIMRDVTERKRFEEERGRLIAELREKNSELEQFTYTVSHDLKAPLITIRGFLGFLDQDLQAGHMERARTDIARIADATDKMQRLIIELLDLSRVGRITNPFKQVAFGTIVQDAIEVVAGQITMSGVHVNIASNLPIVHGDQVRLTQAVQNLIENAVKFMGDQPEPQIDIEQKGKEEGKPIFCVHDNGIGIAPEHHERIFGLFNKLNGNSDGTGIGLALVKRIVDFHGGRIWVESEVGNGAAFFFTLPGSTEQKDKPNEDIRVSNT